MQLQLKIFNSSSELCWIPPTHAVAVCAAALGRLQEAAKQGRAWLERAEAPVSGVAELRVLEALSSEAGAIIHLKPLKGQS